MVDPESALSTSRQCALLGLSRSSLYYEPMGESEANLALMRRIDELYMAHPFHGSRQMSRHLAREGLSAGRHRVRRLMGLLGLEAIYRKPRTSDPHPGHKVYPYLLSDMDVDRPDLVWCADITCVPARRGFPYLVAVMDWATRHVLAWRLSNTMDAGFCVEALEAALAGGSAPEVFNTDQGSQFTSLAFTERVLASGRGARWTVAGGAWTTCFIERLWRSLKYESIYLRELAESFAAEREIGSWMAFYNETRPHSALGGRTPGEAYRLGAAFAEAA